MGLWVHFHVCFHCHRYGKAASLAKKHLPSVPDDYIYKEAKEFLTDLSSRSGVAPGHKSGLYLWGIIGNYTVAEEFVEILMPFWSDLLTDDESEDGPSSAHNVLVFWQIEDSGNAQALEIGWNDPWKAWDDPLVENKDRKIIVRYHKELPFSWWAQ